MSERVRITDVSPRDGLQNEPGVIPTAEKVRLVELLCRTGVDEVEVTSFVSPRWVPQLGDAPGVLAGLESTCAGTPLLSALVPNEQGVRAAIEVNERAGRRVVGKVSVFTSASESFSRKNINVGISGSLERFIPVVRLANENRLSVRGYLSCAIACPFEGPIDPEVVARWAFVLADMGIGEIDLGDTIGAGTPQTVRAMLSAVQATMRAEEANPVITLHMHDTFGRAAECVKAALDMGVMSFDGSVAGLGGCPYASTPGKRAPGNISTETLVRTVHGAGFETGVDLERLEEAAAYAREIVARSRACAAEKGGTA